MAKIIRITLRAWKTYLFLAVTVSLLSSGGYKDSVSPDAIGVRDSSGFEWTDRLGEWGEVTLLAVGDVNLGRTCGQRIIDLGPGYPFAHLTAWIESFDIAFCNLESIISDQDGETFDPRNRLVFTAPPGAEDALAIGGWDVVSTANNHCCDYGLSALKETISRLDAAGVAYNGTAHGSYGLYRPTYLDACGYRLAFIAVTDIMNGPYEGTPLVDHLNWADRDELLPALREAREESDFVILSYHGGIEYTSRPTRQTREFLRWAVDNGVDVALGHHPHFFQGVEWYKGRLIIYSLGNFTFYQAGWEYWTDYGLAASITLGEEGIHGVEFIPIRAHYQARIVEDEGWKNKILDRLNKLSGCDPSVIPDKPPEDVPIRIPAGFI